MAEAKQGFEFRNTPSIIIESASSAASRVWSWVKQKFPGDEYDVDEDSVVENRHAGIQLKSILKKDAKKKEKRDRKVSRMSSILDRMLEFMRLETKRREREAAPHRKGPIPMQDLPVSDRRQSKQTHATLNPGKLTSLDEDEASCELPSNRGLLTYFARISRSSNEDERVDLRFVNSLLLVGADINIGDKHGQTVLHAIARDWHTDVAKFAIDNGGDINICDAFGRTPLHVAAAVNYPAMIEFLVQNGAKLHAKTMGELQTPMHYAARNNAVESLKCLMKLGGKVSDRDYKDRTPLFLAAEQGRQDAVEYFLRLGVASAVYDCDGNCAVSLMIEKMPQLAKTALDQFFIEDKPNRKNFYYLSNLEFDVHCKLGRTPARPVLETLVYQEDINLVQHPVINKLIEVKWKKFGKLASIIDIILNLLYACAITALAADMPNITTFGNANATAKAHFYTPLKTRGWRIGLEAFFIILTIYFIFTQTKTARRVKQRHENWRKWRIRCMSRDLKHCHPQWPEEKRYLKGEIKRIQEMPSAFLRGLWDYYEWVSFIGIFAIIGAQIAFIVTHASKARTVLDLTYLLETLLIWLRLLKPFKTVSALSGLIVMLGDIAKGTLQYAYIFLEFFIPISVAFFVMFGGEENAKRMKSGGISAEKIQRYSKISETMFTIYWVTFGGSLETDALEAVDREMAHVMVSLFFAVLKIMAVNLYIALMSELFQRVYKNAKATALLQTAAYLLQAERNLSIKNSKKLRKDIRRECSPLETYESIAITSNEQERELETAVESINKHINVLTNALSKKGGKHGDGQMEQEQIHKAQLLMNSVDELIQIHGQMESVFKEKWAKIEANQKNITKLLKSPEVARYLEKVAEKKKQDERRLRASSVGPARGRKN